MTGTLDLVTIGRASVDLYGAQIGGRLEDMGSFHKYPGGSPANIAAGAARLGLRPALITRVGDEHMGRFIREALAREGVDTSGIVTDPDRLTALVLLGIRDREQFPLIFYRENCADMALCEDDIDPALIGRTRAVVATGTHLSHPRTAAAVLKALRLGRENGARTALDIDYRPNLWGLSGHGDGENRFVASARVTAQLQSTLPLFDLIVGTEEEFHIAGGDTDTIRALRAVRAISDATLVCKRGPMGAVAFQGEIPDRLAAGESGPGFPVEVFNVLGAGDGFMAGLLQGWLDDVDWRTALTRANACGAFAVSRHGCTPAFPSREELQHFLDRGVVTPALRHDAALEQLHWSTTRPRTWPDLRVFAFDRQHPFEAMPGTTPERIAAFKALCLTALLRVAAGRPGYGLRCDSRAGRDALWRAAGQGLWIGRPVAGPATPPLTPDPGIGPDFGGLVEWPLAHVVMVPWFCHPGDNTALRTRQEDIVHRLSHACRRNRLEWLLEIVPPTAGPVDDGVEDGVDDGVEGGVDDETMAAMTAGVMQRVYNLGLCPDWWQLVPFRTAAAWQTAIDTIRRNDPHGRGIVVSGPDAPPDELAAGFTLAARYSMVRGFTVGRPVFDRAARDWMAGRIDDTAAIRIMQDHFSALCTAWDKARDQGRQP